MNSPSGLRNVTAHRELFAEPGGVPSFLRPTTGRTRDVYVADYDVGGSLVQPDV